MPIKSPIAQRLEEFGKSKFGDKHGWKTQFATALKCSSNVLSQYLSGRRKPGNEHQQRLRDLGCDIDWLMTGKEKNEGPNFPENVLVSFSGTPSPAVLKRIQRLAEWMSTASEEDVKMLEQVARKILRSDEKDDKD